MLRKQQKSLQILPMARMSSQRWNSQVTCTMLVLKAAGQTPPLPMNRLTPRLAQPLAQPLAHPTLMSNTSCQMW